MSKVKKFILYLFTYILITFTTAFGVVFISNPTSATNKPTAPPTSTGGGEQSPLTYIVDNFSSLNGINLNAAIKIATNGKNINVNANVLLDLSQGLEKIAVGGNANLLINNQPINAEFAFIDNQLYLSALNGNYKIAATDIPEALAVIGEVLNVDIPDLGSTMANLDLNSMLTFLSDVEEVKTLEDTTLYVTIPKIGKITIVCDLNYSIKSITVPQISINGTTIEANINATYPENTTLQVPQKQFIDLSHVFKLTKGVSNFITKDKLNLNFNLTYNEQNYLGNLNLDLTNLNFEFETKIDNKTLVLTKLNKILYLEFENLYLQFNFDDLNKIVTFLNNLGVEIPTDQIMSVIYGITSGKLDLSALNLDSLDLSQIDLSILEQFTYSNNNYHLKIKDLAEVSIEFENESLKTINLTSQTLSANVEAIAPTTIELNKPQNTYVNFVEAIPSVEALLNTLELNHHIGTINLKYNDFSLDVDYEIFTNNGVFATFKTNLYGYPITLNFANDKIYLSVMDVNLVCEATDVDLIKEFLNKHFNLTVEQPQLKPDSEQVKDIITNVIKNPVAFISNFETTNNSLNIKILEKLTVYLTHNQTLESVNVNYNNLGVNLTINSNNQENTNIIDQTKYVTVNNLLTLAENTINLTKQQNYYAQVNLNYDNYNINGFVIYENKSNDYLSNLSASLTTTVLNRTINLKLVNKVVYLEVDGLNLKLEINNINELINFVNTNFNIDTKQIVSDLSTQIKNTAKTFDYKVLLNNLNAKLTNENLKVTTNDYNVELLFNNLNVSQLNVEFNKFSGNIKLLNQKPQITLQNNYFEITDALPLAQSLINTLNQKQFEGYANVIYKNYSLLVNYKISLNPTPQVWLQTKMFGATVKLNYINETILISIDDLLLKTNINDIDKITNFINKNFNTNISKESISNLIKQIDFEAILYSLSLKDINNLYADNNNFVVSAFGLNTTVKFDKFINQISLNYDQVYVNVYINNYGNNVSMPTINLDAYDNIEYLLNAAQNLIDGLKTNELTISGDFEFGGLTLPINARLDFSEGIKATLTTVFENKNIELILINNQIYATIDGFKAKYNLNEINQLIDLFKDSFNENTNTNKLMIANKNSTFNFDLSKLLIKNLSKVNTKNGYKFNISLLIDKKPIVVNADFENNKLNNIDLNYNNQIKTKVEPTFGGNFEISAQEKDYQTDLNSITDVITPIKNLVNAKAFEVSGNVNFNLGGNRTLTIKTLKVDFSNINNLKAYAQVEIQGVNATVFVINNTIYVTVDNLKTYFEFTEINDLINWANTTFNINIDVNQTPNDEAVNINSIGNIIKTIVKTPNGILINLQHNNSVTVNYGEHLESVNVIFNQISATLTFNKFGLDVIFPEINLNSYDHINYLLSAIQNVYNGVITNNVSVNGNIKVDNFELPINANINYADGIKAQLATTVFNKQILATLINSNLFADIDGFKVKYNLNGLKDLFNIVDATFNTDINSTIDEVKNTDINQTINNLELTNLSKTSTEAGYSINLNITYNGTPIIVVVNFNNSNELTNVEVNYNNFAYVNANVQFGGEHLIDVNPTEYETNLNDLTSIITPIKNLIDAKAFEVSGNVNFNLGGNRTLTIKTLKVDFSNINNLKAYAQVEIQGVNATVFVINNTIYVTVDNLKTYFEFTEINDLINWVNTTFNTNIDVNANITTNELINNTTIGNVINKITKTPNGILISFANNINLAIDYNSTLKNFNLTVQDVTAQLQFVNFGKEVTFPNINTNSYEHINYLLCAIQNVYNGVITNNVSVNGNVKIDNFELPINANINYADGIKAQLATTVFNKQILATLINSNLFADIDGFKVKYNLNGLKDLFNIVDATFNTDINSTIDEVKNTDINQTINNLELTNLSKTSTEAGYSINLNITYNGTPIIVVVNFNNSNELTNVEVNYNNFAYVNANVQFGGEHLISVNPTEYETNLNDLTNVITPIKNLIDAKAFELSGNIKFVYGADQTVTLKTLKVNFADTNNLKLYVESEFYGIDVKAIIINNTIYVSVDQFKTYISFDEINELLTWVNKTFNTNIELNTAINANELLEKFVIGDLIKSIVQTPNGILINLTDNVTDNVTTYQGIAIDYSDNLKSVVLNLKDVQATINFSCFADSVNFNNISLDGYTHYTEITTLIDSIYDYIISKQYTLSANALVFNGTNLRFDANIDLNLDITNNLLLDGHASLTGEQDISFDVNYWNKYMFVNYNNLKLKMCEADLKELLVIVLELIGVDPTLIPFLQDAADSLDNINFDSVSNLIPDLNSENPLGILNLLSGLNFENGTFTIKLDGTRISDNPNAKEMTLVIKTENNTLKNLSLNNIYTGVTEDEFFNLNVNFNGFSGVNAVTDEGYIDLSGTNELVKAVINTAELNYFEINGSALINGNLIGININWNVPLNIKVKLDENRKPEVMITIGAIPTMVGVNNDVPFKTGDTESGSDRMLYIYYKDSKTYFYRSEYVDIFFGASKRKYEKKLMVDIQEVLDNPLFYLQWGVGFTQDIMNAIQASLDKSIGHTPNLGNVINYFSVEDEKNFEIQLNMREITNDPLLDDMTIGIGVINNESTNNKNYVGKATFSMFMPLANAFKLTLSSNNLTLINIGKELDFTTLYNYINSYTYLEGVEWEASNGNWQKASEVTYTLTFEENGGAEVSDINAIVNANITLPTYTENLVVNDTENGVRTIYSFGGWYTTSNFKEGTQFTETKMPRGGKTLYAKWNVVAIERIVTISFNSNGGTSFASISGTSGTWVDISSYKPHKCDSNLKWNTWGTKHTHTRYTFEGWYLDSALTQKFNGYYPSYNITLYAKYTSSTFTHGSAAWVCNQDCC